MEGSWQQVGCSHDGPSLDLGCNPPSQAFDAQAGGKYLSECGRQYPSHEDGTLLIRLIMSRFTQNLGHFDLLFLL